MTPSLFAGTDAQDEYGLMQTPGAVERIEVHRQTFITEDDFVWLHSNGVTAIRIPVGYWVLKSDVPYVSANRYLDWAMVMAEKYNLQVIIDLHGLKGSQNGFDHSGKVGKAEWFRSQRYREQTLDTLAAIAIRYKAYPHFWGLQVINEPRIGVLQLTLRSYYRKAYDRLSKILLPHTRIIYSDAFSPRLLSLSLRNRIHPVVMDVHLYHMTSFRSRYFSTNHYFKNTARRQKMLQRLSKVHPIIIGEWSGVMRGETMRCIPADQHDELFRKYVALQQLDYRQLAGSFYWNYKTEAPGAWNYRSEVEHGAITSR